jgi:hypothetical protein
LLIAFSVTDADTISATIQYHDSPSKAFKYIPSEGRGYIWIDALCIDQRSDYDSAYRSGTDVRGAYKLLNSRLKGRSFEEDLSTASLWGLCIHGRLKLFLGGDPTTHNFILNCPGTKRNDRNSDREMDCCHSTKTLSSRSKESLEGTGRWFLQTAEYLQWRDQPSNLLWLTGRSGAGKSVLMSTVIHDLQTNRRKGELVAYYFADGYYQGAAIASAILRAMLGQLLSRESNGKLVSNLRSLLKDLLATGSHLSLPRMSFFLSKIRHEIRGHETLYLLLDGLDEVDQSPHEQELVLKLIEHASRYDPNHRIKCLLSSRSSFFGKDSPNGALRVELDAHPLTRADMNLYVRDSLKNAKLAYSPQDFQDLAEQLLNTALGSFLILRLILEANAFSPEDNNYRVGRFTSSFKGTDAHNLPEIYSHMLERINDSDKVAALSMLRWVTYVARPLESDELLDALYKQTGIEVKKEDISSISAGLLDTSGSQILFTHFSVREFLESQLSGKWEEISDEANEMIAHALLKLLCPDNLLQSLSLPTRKSPAATNTLGYHQNLMPYARTYWMFHYKRAERRSSYLPGLLHHFLKESLLKDLQDLDSTKEIVQASRSKIILRDGLNPTENFHSLDLINTALRVSARFGFLKLAKLELDMGAKPNMRSGPDGCTPLHLAAKYGYLELAKLLLQRGADPSVSSGSGKTPFIYAMINGHFDILDVLMTSPSEKLRRGHFQGQASPGVDGDANSQSEFQELSLTALIYPSCTVCNELQIDWQVSFPNNTCKQRGGGS